MSYVEIVVNATGTVAATDPAGFGYPGFLTSFEQPVIPPQSEMLQPDTSDSVASSHTVGPQTTVNGYQWGYSFDGAAYARSVGIGPQQGSGSHYYEFDAGPEGSIVWFQMTLDDWYDGAQTTGYGYSWNNGPEPTWSAIQFWSPQDPTGSNLRLHIFYYPIAGVIQPYRARQRLHPIAPARRWPREAWQGSSSRRVGGYR